MRGKLQASSIRPPKIPLRSVQGDDTLGRRQRLDCSNAARGIARHSSVHNVFFHSNSEARKDVGIQLNDQKKILFF